MDTPDPKEQTKHGSSFYRNLALALAVILVIIFLGKRIPEISLGWLVLVMAMYFLFLGYKYYQLRLQEPNMETMISLCKNEASKRHIQLYDGRDAVLCEPIGELSAVQFLDPRYLGSVRTFLLKGNVVRGISPLSIQQLKKDYQRSRILEEYARHGAQEEKA